MLYASAVSHATWPCTILLYTVPVTVQQDATIYSLLYFCKLLCMFWVVIPPIIRSTYNCNYSIWHWSNRLRYLPLSWSGSNCSMTAEGSRDGLTSARCRDYSYMCSWWWVESPPKTCRAVYRNIIDCTWSHLVGQLLTQIHDARAHEHKIPSYTCQHKAALQFVLD